MHHELFRRREEMFYVLFKSSVHNLFNSSSVPTTLIAWVICNFEDPPVTRKKIAAYCDQYILVLFIISFMFILRTDIWLETGLSCNATFSQIFYPVLFCYKIVTYYPGWERDNRLWLHNFISGIGSCCGPGPHFFWQDPFLWRDSL